MSEFKFKIGDIVLFKNGKWKINKILKVVNNVRYYDVMPYLEGSKADIAKEDELEKFSDK